MMRPVDDGLAPESRARHDDAVKDDDETRALGMSVSNINNVLSSGAPKSVEKASAASPQGARRTSEDVRATQTTASPASRVSISGAARDRIAAEHASIATTSSSAQPFSTHAASSAVKFLSSLYGASNTSASTSAVDHRTQLQAGLGALQRTSQANEAVLNHFQS